MTLKTHPNFKSVNPVVRDAETIADYLREPLHYQFMFDKRTTPWELQQWDYEVLQSFEINLEKVDRLYDVQYENDGVGIRSFGLIARMEYEEQSLYVELIANCDYTGFDCQGGGYIFISKDANLFFKLVLRENLNKNLIYESLKSDSIYVEEEEDTDYDKFSRMMWKTAPMLKYLCHEAIYQNREPLQGYSFLLPKILTESIDDFIKTKEAKIAYNGF